LRLRGGRHRHNGVHPQSRRHGVTPSRRTDALGRRSGQRTSKELDAAEHDRGRDHKAEDGP
jgi:hypothetical protein